MFCKIYTFFSKTKNCQENSTIKSDDDKLKPDSLKKDNDCLQIEKIDCEKKCKLIFFLFNFSKRTN